MSVEALLLVLVVAVVLALAMALASRGRRRDLLEDEDGGAVEVGREDGAVRVGPARD